MKSPVCGLFVGLSLGFLSFFQPLQAERPQLVVGIVVDQMRWDYLSRYADRMGPDGFLRLQREGFSFNCCLVNYLPAVTAAGHAAIFTGSIPALNGIVGNDFYVNDELFYCTSDPAVKGVGTDSGNGSMSPCHLLPTTITDELRMSTHFRSRVVGVSLKDRAAILPAGHTANAAYWYDTDSMRFVSSSYYLDCLPEWVNAFNRTHPVSRYVREPELLYLASSYVQSERTDTLIELQVKNDIRYQAAGNTYTLEMAWAAVEGEKLGRGSDPDFLTINLASTDYIGHACGPDSPWVEDAYLRLDQDLSKFLCRLDKYLGEDRYLLFLTADHGGSHNVLYRQQHKLPSLLYEPEKIQHQVDSLLQKVFPSAADCRLVRSMNAYRLHFDHHLLDSLHLEYSAVVSAVCRFLESQPQIAYAFDLRNIPCYVPDCLRQLSINGYNPQRGGDIQLILQNGVTKAYKSGPLRYKGAEHAVWCPDDTHIPLIFMGCGISPGSSNKPCHITDIAPTLSLLLGIQFPSASVGQPLF